MTGGVFLDRLRLALAPCRCTTAPPSPDGHEPVLDGLALARLLQPFERVFT